MALKTRNQELLHKLSEGKESIEKLAYSTMDRKSINKQISKIQKELSKARQDYIKSSNEMKSLEAKMNASKKMLEELTKEFLTINDIGTKLDLSGADSASQHGDDLIFMIGGKRMHVDTSDVNDIKIIPWREYTRSRRDSAAAEDNPVEDNSDEFFDVQFDEPEIEDALAVSDIESKYITKIAKKFR